MKDINMYQVSGKWGIHLPSIFLFFIFYFLFSPVRAQIGTWHNYLAYYDVQQIQDAGDDLFVRASNSLYKYNQKDQSIVTYDKVNGLSDTNISHIRWCQKAKRLVVVYQNSNIDLVTSPISRRSTPNPSSVTRRSAACALTTSMPTSSAALAS